ncbi:MAG: ATP-binding protein [Thermoanaerobaculia bacterium]|nr:ATP-binding protein [Thermoanaerobaculia bacterium]
MRYRRYLVLVLLAVSVALVATVLASLSSVREVQRTLVRGQGDSILDAARRLTVGPPEGLEALLSDLAPDGLRCIAVFRPATVEVYGSCRTGGDSELREALATAASDEQTTIDDRIAMVRGSSAELATATASGRAPVLVEFEPLLTRALQRAAVRSLAIAGAAAVALVVVAVGLWRLGAREARLQERLEHDRRLASLGEMAAVLAHEIRNPLASMKGHAQLLAEQLAAGSPEHEKADRVVREVVRLEELTSDLLGFVRSKHIEREPASPAELLRSASEDVGAAELDLDLGRAPERWSLDPRLMRQVLANLLRNAVQASPNGRPAAVGMRVEGDELVIEVRDHGEGVPAGEEERIFEPFHTTRLHGTGLGLAVARRIVALHGGTISTMNHPDGGAVFRVAIPKG